MIDIKDLKTGMKVTARWGRAGETSPNWGPWKPCTVTVETFKGKKPTKSGLNPGDIVWIALNECEFGEYALRDYCGNGQFLKEDYYLEIKELMGKSEEAEDAADAEEMMKHVLSSFASVGLPTSVEVGGKVYSTGPSGKVEADESAPVEKKTFTLNQLRDGKVRGRIGDKNPDGSITWRDWAEYNIDVDIREGGYLQHLYATVEGGPERKALPEDYDQTHWDAKQDIFIGDVSAFEIEGLTSPKSVAEAAGKPKPTTPGAGLGAGMMSFLGGGGRKKSVGSPFGLKAMGGSGREVAKADPPPPPEKQAWADYQRELREME